jgi:hypothetical protein
MGEIVFGVGENKYRMADFVVPIGTDRFCGRRDPGSPLGCLDGGLGAGQTDETLIEIIEPRAQHLSSIARRIGRVERTLIGTIRISEKAAALVSRRLLVFRRAPYPISIRLTHIDPALGLAVIPRSGEVVYL